MSKSDEELVRTINGHLNLLAMSRMLDSDEMERFRLLVEGGRLGWHPTGFCIKSGDGPEDWTYCPNELTTLVTAVHGR